MASNGNNNDDQEKDPWADIFDRAEGKISLGKNDGVDEEHAATTATGSKRPKLLHHVTKATSQADAIRRNNNGNDNDNAMFQKYLNERSAFQTQLRLEDGIFLKESLSASSTTSSTNTSAADMAACQGWKGAAAAQEGRRLQNNKNKKQQASAFYCCQSCGRSSFYHRAATAVDEKNKSKHDVFVPLQLYCMLRNLRHVAILFLTTTTTTSSSTAENAMLLNGQDDDDDDDDNADFVGWPLLDGCTRIVAALLQQPEVAISLQTQLATLQALLHQQKQQVAFKKRKTQTTTSKNHKNNSSSAMSVQQRQQHQREEAIRIMMQCDECYYQLYYLEITRQLTGGVFSFQHNRRGGGNRSKRRSYIPHPTVYFGESFMMMMNETSSNNTSNSNNIQHYLDSARDLISTWKSSLDDDSSVVARFQLNFEQQYEQQQHPSVASALGKSSKDMMDALSALHYIRFLETITFFDIPKDTSWLSSSSTKAPSSSLLSKRKESSSSSSSLTAPPPAPALLMEWRDSCRDFLTHLYAYATLPPDLISRILQTCRQEKIQNIIEVGAGTGYVAHLFNVQQKGNGHDMIGVEACDLLPTTPPSPASSSAVAAATSTTTRMNEYHGDTPPFTHVAKASCTQALQNNNNNINSKTALLLCYPPPDSSMALDAVQMFCKFANDSNSNSNNNSSSSTKKKRRRRRRRGNDDTSSAPLDAATTVTSNSAAAGSLVIYIGEFQGLTGTRNLEHYLIQNFDCIARYACPTWGTDATSVTIWKVRKHALSSSSLSSPSLLIPCHYCQEKPATKRLRYIRHLEYCSKICFQADCQSGVVHQHAKCSRLYLGGGGGGGGVTTGGGGGGSGTGGAANDTTTAEENMSTTSCCALDFDNNKQHFLDLTY